MNPSDTSLSILYAFGASTGFAFASIGFRRFSRKVSPMWTNSFKGVVAWICFSIAILVTMPSISSQALVAILPWLLVSGAIGLVLADVFLLRSYRDLGPGRTLMVFSFQPIFAGSLAWVIFGESISTTKLVAIVFLTGCVWSLALESKRNVGRWNLGALGQAGLAATLDATGVLLTKQAFSLDPTLTVFVANWIRCSGALLGFWLVSRVTPLHLWSHFAKLNRVDRSLAILCSTLGTFVSLTLWLKALSLGSVATVMAVGGTAPLVSTTLECWIDKKKPHWTLFLAGACFVTGFYLLAFRQS